MSRFTVILPEGTVILKNEATGETLRLSAESGPLVLGEIEMTMTLAPKPLAGTGATLAPQGATPASAPLPDSAFEVKPDAPGTAPLTQPLEGPEGLTFSNPYETLAKVLPPGFGPNEGEPFLSPETPMDPTELPATRGIRVLDAPLEALTPDDFERTLEALALRRNNVEGEMEFLEEIEADEIDIAELGAELEAIDRDIADVVARKETYEAMQRRRDEE